MRQSSASGVGALRGPVGQSHHYLELYHAGLLGRRVIKTAQPAVAPMELELYVRDSGADVVFVDQPFARR